MKIVVIGGTGLIGSGVVALLAERGHEAVAAAPNTGVNTLTGEGLAEALDGADVVVDVSNSPSFEAAAALEFFRTATGNLLAAEEKAGVGHHVALSVVGTDRLAESGYMRAKIAQEQLIQDSPVPWSLVHATQFFEFLKGITDAATHDGVVSLAPVGIQPVAARDVSAAVADVATGTPLRSIVEVAGPQRFQLDELVRKALAAQNDPREVRTDPSAPYFGATLGEDTLLPADDARLGGTTLAEWKAAQSARS
ncbi:SDR family oxidoreductase [Jiangella anatolica]|uniref:NmrA family transcriptional regulator n=1 Tax=Jiangella anatolica TaxID=2670374 RepID=A0A2W2C1R7_9ACTN|nr:SDR family oxidoreductase [Jiangella anatolica]PZF81917.1 NmrA family transcriptional regulator [Jiangella anatolica]